MESFEQQIETLVDSILGDYGNGRAIDRLETKRHPDKDVIIDLVDDIKTNLSIGYSINPDFFDEAVKEESKNYARMSDIILSCEGGDSTVLDSGTTVSENYAGVDLDDGEILLSAKALRELFPEISNDMFTFPQKLTVEKYEYPNGKGKLIYSKTFTVVGMASYITLSEEEFEEYKAIDIIPYSVYVDSPNNPSAIIDGMEENYFTWNSTKSFS